MSPLLIQEVTTYAQEVVTRDHPREVVDQEEGIYKEE